MRYVLAIILVTVVGLPFSGSAQPSSEMEKDILLPAPQLRGKVSLEQAISERRSKRSFSPAELSLEQIGQLLWSAQGITDKKSGYRASPSAGALYPMQIYLFRAQGLFRYLPEEHKIEQVLSTDLRPKLANACFGQRFVAQAPIDIVIVATYEKITSRYRERGKLYTDIEAGHIAQNIHLQAVALGLGSVPVGAFDEQSVGNLLKLADKQVPLYIIPVGYPR